MTLQQFVADSKLVDLSELEKACHLAFFHFKKSGIVEFRASDCAKWIDDLHMGKPNTSRLHDRLRASRDTVRGGSASSFRLHHSYLTKMEGRFPTLSEQSQEVVDFGTILPPSLYENTRGYIERLAKQINRSYEENIFDGCAVLMRRLEEVLLILSYQHLKIDNQIRDSRGNYLMLEGIVSNAQTNNMLQLSRNVKQTVEKIREMGNYSAHNITYLCQRRYIEEKIEKYRLMIGELLNKAGIR